MSSEITFDPNTQQYNFDSQGVLNLWGVPEASGNALVANPDFGWPSPLAVAAWFAVILKAQEMQKTVVVAYDPNTLDIWYVVAPR